LLRAESKLKSATQSTISFRAETMSTRLTAQIDGEMLLILVMR
jgi:hypothetical protein